jgi:hypothetical protein
MHDAPPDWAWGEWVFGDLADTLRKISEIVGRRATVLRASVFPPATGTELPEVCLVVPSALNAHRLKSELLDCERPVTFVGRQRDGRWQAEIAGTLVTVIVEGSANEPGN